jgi:hypothetical protein
MRARKGGKLKQSFFAREAVKRLKTQERVPKTNPFWAKTNSHRSPVRVPGVCLTNLAPSITVRFGIGGLSANQAPSEPARDRKLQRP